MIGERYKYNVLTYQNYSLFYRDLDFFKKLLIKIVLKKQFAIFIKLFTLCKSVSGSDIVISGETEYPDPPILTSILSTV